MDRIALAAVIGTSLVFAGGVLVGIILMVSTAIRQISPRRRTPPHLPGAGPDDQGADQPASRDGR